MVNDLGLPHQVESWANHAHLQPCSALLPATDGSAAGDSALRAAVAEAGSERRSWRRTGAWDLGWGCQSLLAARPGHRYLEVGELVCTSKAVAQWSVTFLEQDALQQRVLVAQHQTLVGGAAVALLQVLQGVLMVLDGALELLDVLGAALTEGSLGLAVALLALLRSGIDLAGR